MTGLNMASRDTMKNAQIIDYIAPASFDASFNQVRAEAEVCIIAALTDLILAGGDSGTISASIDPILLSFRTKLFDFCASRPALQASSQHVITSGRFEHFHQAHYSGILSVSLISLTQCRTQIPRLSFTYLDPIISLSEVRFFLRTSEHFDKILATFQGEEGFLTIK